MKISKLKELLKNVDDNVEVCIVLESAKNIIYNGTNVCTIDNAIIGFDWDMGKLLLTPTHKLIKLKDVQIKQY